MDQEELVGVGVVGGGDLDAEVEEADAVFKLLARRDSLAADRGRGFVACGRVVGAGDGEGAERGGVREFVHPGVEVGG